MKTVSDLCPHCVAEEDKDFKTVKDLIMDSKQLFSVDELHELTGVSMKRIIKFIRQGRLQFANLQMVLTCENCGEPIEEGRFCNACKAKMLHGLQGEPASEPEEPQERRSSSRNSRMFLADLAGKNRR